MTASADQTPPSSQGQEKPWLPWLALFLLPLIARIPQWIMGLNTDPIGYFSGVTQNLKGGKIFGLPYFDPHIGWTTDSLGRLAAWDWLHGIIPWWNSYTGLGMPLAGEMQPGAFFLPFNLLLLLPHGVTWLQIALQILSGFFTYGLLSELKLGKAAAFTGAVLFAFNGTIAWTPGPIAAASTCPFLPLLLWGIERTHQRFYAGGSAMIAAAIAWLVFAGFPETAYLDGLLGLTWAAYRLCGTTDQRRMVLNLILGGSLGILLATPLLIAFVGYYFQSGIAIDHHHFGFHVLGVPAFATIFMPYIFGAPPAPFPVGGYSGILVFVLAATGLLAPSKERGLMLLLLIWTVIAWAKTFGVPVVMFLVNHLPFLNEIAFQRYATQTWELACIIMASFGFDALCRPNAPLRRAFAAALFLLAASLWLAWPDSGFDIYFGHPVKIASLWRCLAFSLSGAVIALAALALICTFRRAEQRAVAIACLLILESVVFFIIPQLTGLHRSHVDLAAIDYLQAHQGLARSYSLGPLAPNYGAFFHIAEINHNVLPVPGLWADYIDQNLLPGILEKSSGVIFWSKNFDEGTGEHALLENLPHYQTVGVQYILTNPDAPLLGKELPVAASGDQALALNSDQSLSATLAAPAPFDATNPLISSVEIVIGTYNHKSDGLLEIHLCNQTQCRDGRRPVKEILSDNHFFSVPLDQPLAAPAGSALTFKLAYAKATTPLALFLKNESPGNEQHLQTTAPLAAGKALKLVFNYETGAQKLHKVYSDSLMDIWKLEDAAPYYEITAGGPCQFSTMERERVSLNCASPAQLTRRELYMPGWKIQVNGKSGAVTQDNTIFQNSAVPQGHSDITYDFTPPHMGYGWGAAFLGLIGLLAQLYRARKENRHE